jgi:hypothetical protein
MVDIGSDTLIGVNEADYKPPFPLTAKFNKHVKVDPPQLSPADIKKLEAAMIRKAPRHEIAGMRHRRCHGQNGS